MTGRTQTPEPITLLIERIRRGEDVEASFQRLFSIFYPRVYRSFPPRVRTTDREDLTLDAFERVYKNIGRAPTDESGFARWLHRIAKNLYINWIRYQAAAKREAVEVSIPDERDSGALVPVASDNPEMLAVSRESLDHLGKAIRELAPAQRRCVLLFAFGFTVAEIAAETSSSVNTVKTHLQMARARLRRMTSQVGAGRGYVAVSGGER